MEIIPTRRWWSPHSSSSGGLGDYARRIVLAVDGNQQSKGPRPFIEAPSLLLATQPSFRPPSRSSGGGGRPPKADPSQSS
jgi:hypothetical protein